jgi:hypothetical protein
VPSNARRMVATAMLGTAMTSALAGERHAQHPALSSAGRMSQHVCCQASPRPRPSPSRQYGCSFGPSYCTTACEAACSFAPFCRACNTLQPMYIRRSQLPVLFWGRTSVVGESAGGEMEHGEQSLSMPPHSTASA